MPGFVGVRRLLQVRCAACAPASPSSRAVPRLGRHRPPLRGRVLQAARVRLRRDRLRGEHRARRVHGRPRARRALRRQERVARARGRSMVYGALEIWSASSAPRRPVALDVLTTPTSRSRARAPGSLAALTVARGGAHRARRRRADRGHGRDAAAPLARDRRRRSARRRARRGKRLVALYAINTAGGALGALASAYAILPVARRPRDDARRRARQRRHRRSSRSSWAAAGAAAPRRRRATSAPEATTPGGAAPRRGGDAAGERLAPRPRVRLGLPRLRRRGRQTHLLALLIGNSAYAFGLMLAVFLVCLSVGAARAPAFARATARRARARPRPSPRSRSR